jgi:hypothetical protein
MHRLPLLGSALTQCEPQTQTHLQNPPPAADISFRDKTGFVLDYLTGGVLLQLVDSLQPNRMMIGWKGNQAPHLVALDGVDLL